MSSMLKSFAHAQKHRISTICGEDNGLCQSPSFLGQEELGSRYEIEFATVMGERGRGGDVIPSDYA